MSCPIRFICGSQHPQPEPSFYEYLETFKEATSDPYEYGFDQEIYDLLKARLDKEVI